MGSVILRLRSFLEHDVGSTLRRLMRHPAHASMIVLVIGLAVGANTAVFSVVNAVLLRPLPYTEPSRVVVVWQRVEGERGLVSPPDYLDWKQQSTVFDSMGAYTEVFLNLTGLGGESERLLGIVATPSLLQALGVRTSVGRLLDQEDASPGAERDGPPTLISDGLWRRRFGSDPGILGRAVSLNGRRCEVVGVLPPGFLLLGKAIDTVQPMTFSAEMTSGAWRGRRFLTVVGRIGRGHTLASAQAEMDVISDRLAHIHPESNQGRSALVSSIQEETFGAALPSLVTLQGAVLLILLIAGANTAHLQLVHCLGRTRELATRQALGATRGRLIRELVAESVLLAVIGGLLGLLATKGLMGLLVTFVPVEVPRIANARLDWIVVSASFLLAIATGLAVGLWSAWRVSRSDLQANLKQGPRGASGGISRRTQDAITLTELALSVALLVGAGLALRGFARLQAVEPGFVASGTVTVDLSLPSSYGEASARAQFFENLIDRTRHLPGIRAVGITNALPLGGEDSRRAFSIAGTESEVAQDKHTAEFRRVSSGYFEAMGIRLLRGRGLSRDDDDQAPPVVVINQAFARRFLGSRDPLRAMVTIEDGPRRPRQVVGIVADVRHFGLQHPATPTMYVSHLDRPWPNMALAARVEQGDPTRYVAEIRALVSSMDDSVVPANIQTMGQRLSAATALQRFVSRMLAAFAVAALLLAALGLYGVVAHAVEARTMEIALRLAVGAAPRDIVLLVIGHGARLLSAGLVVGAILSLGIGRLLKASLYGVSLVDPMVFIGVASVLAVVVSAACSAPAWRAYRSNPVRLMRG